MSHSADAVAAARRLYLAGELTLCEISERIGIPQHTVAMWRRKYGWAKLPRKAVPTGSSEAPKHNTSKPQRDNIDRQKAAMFGHRREVPPPADADRLVQEWLARNQPTRLPDGWAYW